MGQAKHSVRRGSEMLCYKAREAFNHVLYRESWTQFPSDGFKESMFELAWYL